MDDLMMTRLCAEAMGMQLLSPETGFPSCNHYVVPTRGEGRNPIYDPLHDDAQAMALVKRFRLDITHAEEEGQVSVSYFAPNYGDQDGDLSEEETADRHCCVGPASHNRAIVECVAKMATSPKPE